MDDFHHHTSAVQSIGFHPNMNIMVSGRRVFIIDWIGEKEINRYFFMFEKT